MSIAVTAPVELVALPKTLLAPMFANFVAAIPLSANDIKPAFPVFAVPVDVNSPLLNLATPRSAFVNPVVSAAVPATVRFNLVCAIAAFAATSALTIVSDLYWKLMLVSG